MTNPDSQNPMPDPRAEKPRSLPGDVDTAAEEGALCGLGGGEDITVPEGNHPGEVLAENSAPWPSIPKRENRRRTGVHLDISTRMPARDGADGLPARRVEREFGNLDGMESVGETPGAVVPATFLAQDPVEELEASVAGDADEASRQAADVSDDDNGIQGEDVSEGPSQAGTERVPMKPWEWAALLVLGVMLAALGVGAYFWSIRILPEETPRWEQVDFPVKGQRVEIKNAVTYWRVPVTEGPDKDPIRRGTLLIPVVELDLSGGPAAIRVIFRDAEGRGMGDPVLRAVSSSGKLSLACTAGFEDVGMYAAYRTGDLDPWSVEIFEAESLDSPGSSYSRILKMNLSSEQR